MTVAWPSGLPCIFQLQNMGLMPLSNTIAIDPEVGSPMTRVRFTGEMDDVSGSFFFRTRTQAAAFLTFWRTTLSNGSLPFTFQHPITGAAVSMIFMSGPKIARDGRTYRAAVSLRILPS